MRLKVIFIVGGQEWGSGGHDSSGVQKQSSWWRVWEAKPSEADDTFCEICYFFTVRPYTIGSLSVCLSVCLPEMREGGCTRWCTVAKRLDGSR